MESKQYAPAQSFKDLRVWQNAYDLALLDIRKAPPSPGQIISAGSSLSSLYVPTGTYPTDKPLPTRTDLTLERAILRKSSKEIYKTCELFPKNEQYGLTSQMTRAAVSVCSNIAEGFGRRTIKEKDQFYSIANGSLTELENQILISNGINYIAANHKDSLIDKCNATHKMLITLIKVNREKGK